MRKRLWTPFWHLLKVNAVVESLQYGNIRSCPWNLFPPQSHLPPDGKIEGSARNVSTLSAVNWRFVFARARLPKIKWSGPCHWFYATCSAWRSRRGLEEGPMTLEGCWLKLPSHGPCSLLFRCRNLVPKIDAFLGCLALIDDHFENDSSALVFTVEGHREDPQDSLNWYYLGRLYLQLRQPTKHDAYQQAVYRDGRNAAFWNSIGLLYFGIGQFGMPWMTRAVHHAPALSDALVEFGPVVKLPRAWLRGRPWSLTKGFRYALVPCKYTL